jgi:hypothetical protein
MFPFTRTVLVFFIAGLLFFAPRARLSLGAYRIPRETGPLIPSGPSYLHTIGQVYQGGPAKGLFLLLTPSPATDLAIPGADYSFGQLQLALAQGDFESLGRPRRPVIRLHLSCGAEQGLIQLETILNNALRKRHFAAP